MTAKSRLGQNFLRDQAAVQQIIRAASPLEGRTVVEIGPGAGAITEGLAASATKLVALEFDPRLVVELQERFRGQIAEGRVEVVHQDVLEFDFSALAQKAGQRLVVVGNLPYYITSPILLHLAEHAEALEAAVLMVQREVADRVTAEPGSRDYGLLTVTMQLYGSTEPLFTLPPGAFVPPPQVHSTVFRWRFAPRFVELEVDKGSFIGFLKQVFAQKRKTLANNLRAAGYATGDAAATMERAGIKAMARAEELRLETLASLFREISAESPR
ncbi:16S rRNA (adenine(1518)-N(6)/adenine(1519)-N(6))-dimethyltransferase RsmA [Acidicapsa dinghuensis]|uniref:Ribosomal RNA small subunit methyltransferase A n=1 Tax=Acidicapsa dinghuensis TaxID=2218256 RepID=A0ABW1EI92_9BACT|nr:16S rRNA (adenine(1518)-N(6)/adenine(1519)-N(6))-dimethyltransferase RsmA [Acidicapsa dinghuensis]